MQEYIDVKIINAEPMRRKEAYRKGFFRLSADDDIHNYDDDSGYHILYDTGYHSWCPEKEFEQHNTLKNSLNVTAIQMNSNDYKERFIAEYKQIKHRCDELGKMLNDWDNGIEDRSFTPCCPRMYYDDQLYYMEGYRRMLEKRAIIERIQLD